MHDPKGADLGFVCFIFNNQKHLSFEVNDISQQGMSHKVSV